MTSTHDNTIKLSAETIAPGDDGYQDAAAVYVRTGSPKLIVRPRNPAEVAEAIACAREHGLALSVRSGGHSMLAYGTNDDGLVLDVSAFDDIEVLDEAKGLVRVGAGATWGDVATTLGEGGLTLTSGDTRSVGVGGLTSGGGVGWMVRNHGLTIDSVVAAELVTADGEFHHVDADNEPDLFWAVRGGGGNFGVVTHFEFAAQRVPNVHAGTINYTVEDVPELLRRWAKANREAPEELNTTLVMMPAFGPEMPAATMALVCYAGADGDAADAAFAPLRDVAPVASEAIEAKAYADVLEDAHPPPGVRAMVTNTMVRTVDDEVVTALSDYYADGTAGRMMFIRALGGAMSRVEPDATSFAHRDVEAMLVGAVFRPEPCTDEELLEALKPFDTVLDLGVGAYAGFLGTATAADVRRIYPEPTLARLASVKAQYDPDNLFDQNFNIAPA